jgi:hypothetical protein
MLQDALSSIKTSSTMNNFSENGDTPNNSDWNVGSSAPSSPVPSANQQSRTNTSKNIATTNQTNNSSTSNELSKAATDFLRSLPDLSYILR